MSKVADDSADNVLDELAFSGFEGSYLGNAGKIAADTRMECGICWTVYDPAEGDPVWQIPAGTTFAELPAHWSCPNCDAPRHKFMVLGES